MNKFKKIAAVAASTVMAGTMAFSLAACDNSQGGGGFTPTPGKDEYGILKEDGSINYDAYKRDSEVTLTTAVGHEKAPTSISYGVALGGEVRLPDGNTYGAGDVKPAWVQMGKDLNIKWNDVWTGTKTSDNLKKLLDLDKDTSAGGGYSKVDMFTTDLSKAVEYAASGTKILNLGDYLDRMPNFKMFLEKNPVVYLSLLQNGMDTTTGEGKILYVAPYFDGNDDIERYCLLRQDWAAAVLNGDTATGATDTFAASCAESTSAEPFMGGTNYTIDSLSKDGSSVIKITKNYTNVKTQLGTADSALAKAYNAIAGKAYDGTTGNIVEVMNKALAVNANATGSQLADLLRAYIDACYQNEDGSQHFAAGERANLFNGYDACWDVDDLVAILRVIKANASVINPGRSVVGIVPRSQANDRTPDIVRLACQLYGVRGADSRYEYTYIDNDGNLRDARTNKEFFQAFDNMNKLMKEGLIVNYSADVNYAGATLAKGTTDAFFMYDYVQTQTINGFYAENSGLTGTTVQKGYYFAPVITPVSKWDVDGDGNHTDLMRFTESWRSTKTGGLALNGALADAGNKAKLDAALQFVDYLYSMDGQIVSTFGPMAENAEGKGGFWYNTKATEAQIKEGKFFSYKGEKYAGYENKGEYWPTITPALYESFQGLGSNANYLTFTSDAYKLSGAKLSFTNYARMLIGSTLPVGVKSQAFETQLTSLMGQAGAAKVGAALSKGVVKGMTLEVKADTMWYTCVPTGLPVDSYITSKVLNDSSQATLKYLTGTAKKSGDKAFYSIMNWIILYGGTNIEYNSNGETYTAASITALHDKMVANTGADGGLGAKTRESANAEGWTTAKGYWNFISGQNK